MSNYPISWGILNNKHSLSEQIQIFGGESIIKNAGILEMCGI
jgi:hypothetical protein